MFAHRTDTRGYALLEAATALFIAVTGLFGAMQMFQFGVDKIRVTGEYIIAARAIENELETLRAQPFDSLEPAKQRPFLSVTPEMERLPLAKAYVEIETVDASPSRLREVTVVVRWRTENGRPVERRLSTLIARRLSS